jgi:PDZ domain
MKLRLCSLGCRAVALVGLGLISASLAAAQGIPPEPPGASDRAAIEPSEPNRNEVPRDSDKQADRDNPSRDATEPAAGDRDNPSADRSQTRSTFDDPDAFRDATQRTERDARDASRENSRDARSDRDDRPARESDAVRDGGRRFVPDPRPGGMSEPQSSGNFEVERVRSADVGLWFDRSTAEGLVINDIGSGAISRLGFREGDQIYSVNGVRVNSEAAFVRTLFDPRWRDQRVNVIIYRHGRPWTVYVQPAALVQEYSTVAYDPLDDWGLVLDDRYDDYVVVWRVRPRSPAFYAGLRPGDVIVNWQGRRLVGRDEFVRLAAQGGLSDVALEINRNRQMRRVDLDLSGIGARTSLRPDFESAAGASSSVRPSGAAAGAAVGSRVDASPGVTVRTPAGAEVEGNLRTGSRFESTIDGRLEGSPNGRLDRTSNRSLFPSNAPSGTPTPGTGVRGTVEVPGVEGGVRVQGTNRGGIFGPRRP